MGVNVDGLLSVAAGVQLIVGLIALVDPASVVDCPGAIAISGPAFTVGPGVTITAIGVRKLSHPALVCAT